MKEIYYKIIFYVFIVFAGYGMVEAIVNIATFFWGR